MATVAAGQNWEPIELPFGAFTPYRLELPLDIISLHRVGLIAIGRALYADLMVSRISLFA